MGESLIVRNKRGGRNGNRGVSKTARTCHSDFWSGLTPASSSLLFRKDDVLTIMNMTSSFSRGVEPWYRVSQTLMAPRFSTHSHRYKYFFLSLSLFFSLVLSLSCSNRSADISVLVPRHRFCSRWEATLLSSLHKRTRCHTLSLCKATPTSSRLCILSFTVNLCVSSRVARLYRVARIHITSTTVLSSFCMKKDH